MSRNQQELIKLFFLCEHIPKVIRKHNGNKNIMMNIYRIQAYNSIMCRYFCIGFIGFMLKGKSLLEYTIFFPNEYKDNDKIPMNIRTMTK